MEPAQAPQLPPRMPRPTTGPATEVKSTQQASQLQKVGVFVSIDGRKMEVKQKTGPEAPGYLMHELKLKNDGQVYTEQYLKNKLMGDYDKTQYVLLNLKEIDSNADGFVKVSKADLKILTDVNSVSKSLCKDDILSVSTLKGKLAWKEEHKKWEAERTPEAPPDDRYY